ncbi:MAG: hypothetical protein ACRC8J_09155 [Phocaeicola sp.]
MNMQMLKMLGQSTKMLGDGTKWLSMIPMNLLTGTAKNNSPIRTESAWEEEKEDIIERANWLCEKVIVNPKELLKSMPAILGPQYGGQWAIYSCSMLTAALANISTLYPEEKERNLVRMEQVIDVIMTPEIRYYDTMEWKEDALATLAGNKSHMTYLSILAWAISNYKLIGGTSTKYDEVFHGCCEALNRRMLKRKDLNLPSFPNNIVFLPDMMFAIVALKNYARLYNGMYQESVDKWVEKAKSEWIHKSNGLMVSILYPRKSHRPVKGCYTALNCFCLSLVDEAFARDQYERMKKVFMKEDTLFGLNVCGIKEYLRESPAFRFDVNAGPIVNGFSPSGSAFAMGPATYFQDWEFRSHLLRTAEIAGSTVKEKNNKRHYRLGEMVLVGEATALAMRTNVKR